MSNQQARNVINRLKKITQRKVSLPQRVELVSVHIPKTAGTSFRKTLENAYGARAVIRLDLPLKSDKEVRINNSVFTKDHLPKGTVVVHGHYNPVELQKRFPKLNGLPMLTWLRHPVDRVISNYYYLEKRLREELDEAGKNLNILRKMQRSLLEYARDEINRNRQTKFLADVPLEDFMFVGIVEHYTEDLAEISQRLGWSETREITVNVTSKKKPEVSEEVRAEIARLNAEDMALYDQALHLRARRLEKPKVELISMHVPKTAGKTFYDVLQQVYGNGVTRSFLRKDLVQTLARYPSLEASLTGEKRVIHGHLYYPEVQAIHQKHGAKVICWLRDPVDRVISNYHFFKSGLVSPERNPRNYELNKHRKHESLETYFRMEENQNNMSQFLAGLPLEDFFFFGFLENFTEDVSRLGEMLGWPPVRIKRLNVGKPAAREPVSPVVRAEIARLNAVDVALYEKALRIAGQSS